MIRPLTTFHQKSNGSIRAWLMKIQIRANGAISQRWARRRYEVRGTRYEVGVAGGGSAPGASVGGWGFVRAGGGGGGLEVGGWRLGIHGGIVACDGKGAQGCALPWTTLMGWEVDPCVHRREESPEGA